MARSARRIARWTTRQFGRHVSVFVSTDTAAILFRGRSGFVYKGIFLPLLSSGAASQKQEIADAIWEVQHVKKKTSRSGAGARLHAGPDLLKGHYPNLAEFMTCGVYEDGTTREAPTLTIWAAGGQWKCTVKDRAEGLVMWLSAEKLLELLALVEQMCLEEDGPWRVDDYSPQHGKRKRGLG